MKSILTLTMNPALDISADVPELVPDTKLRCASALYEPGGGGINVARAIHILGGKALALYCAGGPARDRLADLLEKQGVATKVVGIVGNTRENFAVTEASTGHQYRFTLPGPAINKSEINNLCGVLKKLLQSVDYFVISGGMPLEAPVDLYARMAHMARKADCRVILDVAGPPFGEVLKEGVYLVRTNRTDFKKITGVFPEEPADVEPFAQDWITKGQAEAVVITLSSRGTILVTGDMCTRIMPQPVQPLSAVGAGDSFVGGLTLALARDWSLEAAAAFGTAALLSSLETPGTGLCRKTDVQRYFKKMTGRTAV